jgi:hypothetical protein
MLIIFHPVGLARSPYSLFRNKVPLTYPTRFLHVLARISRKSYPTTYPIRTQIYSDTFSRLLIFNKSFLESRFIIRDAVDLGYRFLFVEFELKRYMFVYGNGMV